MRYHSTTPSATRLGRPTFPTFSRKIFARAAVYEAFRPQDAKATLNASFFPDDIVQTVE